MWDLYAPSLPVIHHLPHTDVSPALEEQKSWGNLGSDPKSLDLSPVAPLSGPGDTGTAEGKKSDSASPTALDSTSPTCDDSVITETEATAGPYPCPDVERQFLPKIPLAVKPEPLPV